MIRSLVQAAVSFLLAAREERLALAELHRANASRAPSSLETSAPVNFDLAKAIESLKPKPEEIPFFSCSHRDAAAFVAGTPLADSIACPFHEVKEGTACPNEPEESLRELASDEKENIAKYLAERKRTAPIPDQAQP